MLLAEFRRHANQVRRLHEKLFYRPLLQAVAERADRGVAADHQGGRGPARRARATPSPDGALRHIQALTTGVSRRARDPGRAAAGAAGPASPSTPTRTAACSPTGKVSEALAETPWYLRLLRDEGAVVERLAALLGTSKLVPDLLVRAPEVLRLLADTDGADRP